MLHRQESPKSELQTHLSADHKEPRGELPYLQAVAKSSDLASMAYKFVKAPPTHLQAELDQGTSIAALRRFNDNLRHLPSSEWGG